MTGSNPTEHSTIARSGTRPKRMVVFDVTRPPHAPSRKIACGNIAATTSNARSIIIDLCRSAFTNGQPFRRTTTRDMDSWNVSVASASPTRLKYDWTEVQLYYDEGNSVRACMAHFRITAMTWQKARLRGEIASRRHGMPNAQLFAGVAKEAT